MPFLLFHRTVKGAAHTGLGNDQPGTLHAAEMRSNAVSFDPDRNRNILGCAWTRTQGFENQLVVFPDIQFFMIRILNAPGMSGNLLDRDGTPDHPGNLIQNRIVLRLNPLIKPGTVQGE